MVPRFKIGDRVYHIGRQETGTVIGDGDCIIVEFDNPSPRGMRSIGEFDEMWFNSHDGWLQPASSVGQD